MSAADIAVALGDPKREGRRLARPFSPNAHPAINNYSATRASPPPGGKTDRVGSIRRNIASHDHQEYVCRHRQLVPVATPASTMAPPDMKLVNPFVLFRQQNGGRRMTSRERLPNRRTAETFEPQTAELRNVSTIRRFVDGRLAEIILSNDNAGSRADACARDSAVICSIALQHGVPADVLARALMRDSRGDRRHRSAWLLPILLRPRRSSDERRLCPASPRRARVVPPDPNARALVIEREFTAGTSFDPTLVSSEHFADASDSHTRRRHRARVIPFGDDMRGCHHGICKT
jgi:hypothetical protein